MCLTKAKEVAKMTVDSMFYIVIDVLLAAYAGYSWYWQATLELKARYRWSAIVFPVLLIWIGYAWDYLDIGAPGFNVFLALFILTCLVDAVSGLGSKRVVLSGYFRRTLRYNEIIHVVLTAPPAGVGDISLAALETAKHQIYYMRFDKQASEVHEFLLRHLNSGVSIDLRQIG